MKYIMLDLEWDSAYYPPEKQFINQILQIGAVKLNERLEIIDTFEETIRSDFSKRVTGRFAKLTGITSEIMRNGIPLHEAVKRYNEWAGKDTITMTWSDSDLYSIKRNEEMLLHDQLHFAIERYLDLQKFVQGEMRLTGYTDKNQISLAGAAEYFGIDTEDLVLHTAGDDSRLSVALLKHCYQPERFAALVRDTADPEFYKRLRFKPYPLSNIKDPLIQKEKLIFQCDRCGQTAVRCNAWKYHNRWFAANFKCPACGRKFNGRVSFIKTYDNVKVRRKICECKPKKRTVVEKQDDVQSVPEKV